MIALAMESAVLAGALAVVTAMLIHLRRDGVRAQAGYGRPAIGVAVTALAHEADQQADAEGGQQTFVWIWQMEAGLGSAEFARRMDDIVKVSARRRGLVCRAYDA